jgi:hypothetical protein
MIHGYRLYASIFLILSVVIAALFLYLRFETKEEKLSHVLDQLTIELNDQIYTNEMNALKLAIAMSQNEALINALDNDDEDLGYTLLSTAAKNIETNTHTKIKAQIITSEYNIFARSWDDVYAGMPLGDYRTDLDYFKTHNTPRTSIEVGRRLGIKATVPMYKNDHLLGFFEVIDFFEPITEFFRAQGIDLYVLMDDKYSNTAVLMQDNMAISKYIVANKNYNAAHMDVLKKIDFKQLKSNRIVSTKGRHIFYEPMHNGVGESIGAFVLVLPDKYLDYFQDPEDGISFLINVSRSSLYKIEQNREPLQIKDASDIFFMKDVVSSEDQTKFSQEAYDKLNNYSKDELIHLIVDRKTVKHIDGKIK